MSKKILSLALVVVMLMSMFAFSTSAADLSTGQIGVKVVSNATVGMAAGEVVKVKVYYVIPEGEDVTLCVGNFAIGYTDAYKVNSSATNAVDARTWGASYAEYFKASSTVNSATTISNNIKKKFNANDTAKGWTAALQVQESWDTDNGHSGATGFPVDPDCEVFTLEFVTTKTLTANDTIGLVEGAYGQSFFKLNAFGGSTAGTMYALANVDLSESTAAPTAAAKAPVYEVAKQVQWANDEKTAINLGVKAGFNTADIDIAFNDNGTSTNVMTVGAKLKVNGEDAGTGTSRFVYKISDTEYQYRVILANIAPDSTDVYTVELFVEVRDEATNKTTIITGDTVTITAADVVGKLPA